MFGKEKKKEIKTRMNLFSAELIQYEGDDKAYIQVYFDRIASEEWIENGIEVLLKRFGELKKGDLGKLEKMKKWNK